MVSEIIFTRRISSDYFVIQIPDRRITYGKLLLRPSNGSESSVLDLGFIIVVSHNGGTGVL